MYEFSTYRLDPLKVRLLKGDHVIDIEPQVFNTLLFLVENHHRAVTKDELLAKIWQGRPVTEYVITRIIYELRKILDSSNTEVSHIRTVRSVGYQFNVAVHQQDQAEAIKKPAENDKPSAFKVISMSFLLLLPLMIGYWYSGQTVANKVVSPFTSQTSVSNEKVSSYPAVVLLPIEVIDHDQQTTVLTLSLMDYLTDQLSINLNMKVIHPDSMVNIADNLQDVWSIQQSTRAEYVIQGTLDSSTDEVVVIQFKLYKYNHEKELVPFDLGVFTFPFPNSSQNLSELYLQRKITIRDIISIIKPGIDISGNKGLETHDPEAYRMAIAAHHMVRTDACSNMNQAESLLLRAIDRDPEFGFAYHKLFTNYFKRVWVCGDSAEYHQKALEMANIAEQLSPNTYRTLAIGRNTILVESNQVETAYEYAKDPSWDDPEAIYRAVYGLRYAGFLNVASEYLDRIIQLDPYYFSEKPIQQAPSTLLYQNRFEEHISLLAQPGNSYHDYYRGLNLLLNDQENEAQLILNAVVARTPDDLFGQFSQALLWVIEGNNQAAIELIDVMLDARAANNHNDGEMSYKLLQIYALAGADQQALNTLQKAVDQGFFPFNYFLVDPALISIKGAAQFKSIISQAEARHEKFASRFDMIPEMRVN